MILAFNIGFLNFGWVDFIDIAFVTILLYQLYKLMKGSVAVKIFLGVLSLYLIYLIVKALQMELLSEILGQFMGVGVIAAIILFQPEIRKFLLIIGKSTVFDRENLLRNFKVWKSREQKKTFNLTPIIEAVKTLSSTQTGALVVFSKESPLRFYAESGDYIDGEISKRLLMAIFNKYSPMHDGAVIIHRGRIKAARCILPVSEQENLPAQFGLRHRAAVGMSEATDTLTLIVSEETGEISTARNGVIAHNLSPMKVRKKLNKYLFEEINEAPPEEETASNKEVSKDLTEAQSGV